MEALSLTVAVASLGVSTLTAWLTMGRRGQLKLAQPPSVYFGPDGNRDRHPKVFLRGLLYAPLPVAWLSRDVRALAPR
jgi:hypothetical protein